MDLRTYVTIQGKDVCKKGFRQLMKVSHKVLKRTFDAFKEGQKTVVIPIPESRIKSPKHTATIEWMRAKFNLIGERMPHLDQVLST